MLNSLTVSIIAGTVLGFLAGIGVGGGSLLVLWLTLVVNVDPATVRTVNLMFFIAAAGSVSIFRLRRGTVDWKLLLPGILSGSVSAAIFAVAGRYIDQSLIRKLFGVLLLVTGLREVFYRPRKAR